MRGGRIETEKLLVIGDEKKKSLMMGGVILPGTTQGQSARETEPPDL